MSCPQSTWTQSTHLPRRSARVYLRPRRQAHRAGTESAGWTLLCFAVLRLRQLLLLRPPLSLRRWRQASPPHRLERQGRQLARAAAAVHSPTAGWARWVPPRAWRPEGAHCCPSALGQAATVRGRQPLTLARSVGATPPRAAAPAGASPVRRRARPPSAPRSRPRAFPLPGSAPAADDVNQPAARASTVTRGPALGVPPRRLLPRAPRALLLRPAWLPPPQLPPACPSPAPARDTARFPFLRTG